MQYHAKVLKKGDHVESYDYFINSTKSVIVVY